MKNLEELKKIATTQNSDQWRWATVCKETLEFQDAFNPKTVLELIARIEELESQWGDK